MEQIFQTVGPWHTRIFLISLLGHLPFGLFVISMSFMAPKMDFTCKTWASTMAPVIPASGNTSQDQCVTKENGRDVKCTEWEYDHSVHKRTLIEEVGEVQPRPDLTRNDNNYETPVGTRY